MLIKKIPYYIKSALIIITQLKNKGELINLLRKKRIKLIFRNGFLFKIHQLIDPLFIKETIFDDNYQVDDFSDRSPRFIIDIGAGLGDFSILIAKKFPKAVIFAFEPNKKQFSLLKENLKLNKIKSVKSFNLAIGSKVKHYLYLAKDNGRSSFIKDKYSQKRIVVKGKPLSDYINKKVDLLKVDCEGAELEILKSLPRSKLKMIKKIALEYHNHLVKNSDKKISKIFKESNFNLTKKQDPYNPNIGYIYAENKTIS